MTEVTLCAGGPKVTASVAAVQRAPSGEGLPAPGGAGRRSEPNTADTAASAPADRAGERRVRPRRVAAVGVAIFAGVVLVMAVVVAVVSQRGGGRAERADARPDGLVAARVGAVAWPDIFRVTMLTHHRRFLHRTEFAFVVECEDGRRCTLSSRDGAAQRFLAESHHLPGFAQRAVVARLAEDRSGSDVCFQRQ